MKARPPRPGAGPGRVPRWAEDDGDEEETTCEARGLDKAQTVASMEGATRWEEVDLSDVEHLDVGPDAVAVTYAATARRAGGEPYEANVASLYVRRDGRWQLLLHQQTPRG